jgi:FHA domain-containing protein
VNPVIVIEVLDRSGRVHERVRADAFPITIGRALTNTVIVDDPFVCAEHARIDLAGDGTLMVEDLGSVNGTYTVRPRLRITQLAVEPDCRLRIGQTVLRVRAALHPVAPAVPYVQRPALFARRGRMVAVLAASIVALLGAQYLRTFEELKPLKVAAGIMPFVFMLLAWAGAWAVANRIVSHRFQPLAHCTAAALLGVLYGAFTAGVDYFAFAFAADRSAVVLQWCAATAVLATAFYVHSRLCSGEPTARLVRHCTLAAAGIVGLIAFTTYAADRDDGVPSFAGQLEPPAFRIVPGHSIDHFVTDAQRLKDRVDELIRKARAEDPGEEPGVATGGR